MRATWVRVIVGERITDHPIDARQITVGGSGSALGSTIELGEDLPPGPQLELTLDEGRNLLRVVGTRSVRLGDRVLGCTGSRRSALIEPDTPVYIDQVVITLHPRRPGPALRLRHLALLAGAALTVVALLLTSAPEPRPPQSPTDQYIAALKERRRADDPAALLVHRAVLAEERGDWDAARALYRDGWLAATPDDPLQWVAEAGMHRCPRALREIP